MKHIFAKTPGSLRKNLCLEWDFSVNQHLRCMQHFIVCKLCVSGSSSTSPVVFTGWFWFITSSVWWSEDAHSERWGAGESSRWYSQDVPLFLPLPFAQVLLGPRSWTWSAHAFVLKRARARVAFAKSSVWTPWESGEGAFFSLNTVSSHKLPSLPQWPADCELGFNLSTLGFLAFLLLWGAVRSLGERDTLQETEWILLLFSFQRVSGDVGDRA